MNDFLSKSSFLRGLQCEKALYLHKHHPELRDAIDSNQRQIFQRGTDIGELARSLFPGGASAQDFPEGSRQTSHTGALIVGGAKVIYEAAFSYAGVYCAVDILVRDGDRWRVFEVKSSTSVHEIHRLDAAIQYFVLTGAGLRLDDFRITHLNSGYCLEEILDVQKLFSTVSVIDGCVSMQDDIRDDVERLRSVLRRSDIPSVDIGEHCSSPYPCEFMGHCWKHIPEISIFDLRGIGQRKAFELYRAGIVRIDEIPVDFEAGRAAVYLEAHRSGAAAIDREAIRAFLNTLEHPLHYMDFETIFPPLPIFRSTRPYQQIVFQYCLGVENQSQIVWTDFLADTGSDPRRPFIESLLRNIQKTGSVVVYNKTFEIARLRELAEVFPDLRRMIERLIARICDLMEVFRDGLYYDPRMLRSYSLKKVLPVFAPELDYGRLEIQDGGSASLAFEALQSQTDPEKIKSIREAMIRYCRNDTEGMLRIYEGLVIL